MNTKEMCRLCLRQKSDTVPVALEDSELREVIDKLFCCQINRSKTSPTFICHVCRKTVMDFHQYAEQVLINQEMWDSTEVLVEEYDLPVLDSDVKNDTDIKIELLETEWVEADLISEITTGDEDVDVNETIEVTQDPELLLDDVENHTEDVASTEDKINESGRYELRHNQSLSKGICTKRKLADSALDRLVLKHHKLICDLCSTPLKNFIEMRKHFTTVHEEEPYLKCCDKKLYKKYRMVQHLQLHIDPNAFRCNYCKKRYSSKKVLREHMKEICLPKASKNEEKSLDDSTMEIEEPKSPEPPPDEIVLKHHKLSCDLCSAPIDNFKMLRAHFLSVHNEIPYLNCCGKKLYKRFQMVQHLQLHLDPAAFRCDICNKNFASKRVLREHQVAFHESSETRRIKSKRILKPRKQRQEGEPPTTDELVLQHYKLSCDLCEASIDDFRELREHFESVHNEEPYLMCCDKKLYKKYRMVQHLQLHLDPSAFQCNICGKNYNSKKILREHEKEIHVNPKPIKTVNRVQCETCKKEFDTEGLLKAHQRKSHSLIKCPQCFKDLVPGSLWKHLLSIHGNASQYVCEICARSFRDKRCFQAHLKGHMGTRHEDRVQCTICLVWLTNKYQLTKHIKRRHVAPDTTQKHQCNVCGKLLKSREAVHHHKHRYHGPLRYECEACHQKFRMIRLMREHVGLQHTGQYLYDCNYCDEKFFTKNKHYTHRKNVHPVEFEQDLRTRLTTNVGAEK
ncbi:transcription factor grauzone-like [Wyeomyia smithii]|uniref:transcription factor grauzone-like n=1 Tax=Wyeomyia smithii TaxID=174621 RepID=UPI0024680150|nr:transcription factor grauzone-like [Wyeomyia smithii]